ncbi:GTP-binding protein [Apiospora arundinis]
MDPLSVIASIAGISQAGVSLSRGIFNLLSALRHAPKEAYDVAKTISDLSIVLSELRRVLRDGRDIIKRKLLRRVASAMRRIRRIHEEIGTLIQVADGAARFLWAFRRSKCAVLLQKIESFQVGINLILQIILLALQLKQRTRRTTEHEARTDTAEAAASFEAVSATERQQAENMVQVSYHSIRTIVCGAGSNDASSNVEDTNVEEQGRQLQVWKLERDDSAMWLYGLAFSSTVDAEAQEPPRTTGYKFNDEGENEATSQRTTQELEIRNRRDEGSLHLFVQEAPNDREIVKELLSEWTTLTEREIEMPENGSPPPASRPVKAGKPKDIHFKDAVGRVFLFPWELAKTWTGVEKLIKDAFTHVDVLGPHVMATHYDVLDGASGAIMLPAAWERLINPGMSVVMHMWPMDRRPEPSRNPESPREAMGLPVTSSFSGQLPAKPRHVKSPIPHAEVEIPQAQTKSKTMAPQTESNDEQKGPGFKTGSNKTNLSGYGDERKGKKKV